MDNITVVAVLLAEAAVVCAFLYIYGFIKQLQNRRYTIRDLLIVMTSIAVILAAIVALSKHAGYK